MYKQISIHQQELDKRNSMNKKPKMKVGSDTPLRGETETLKVLD